MTNELTADGLRELVAGATPSKWEVYRSGHGAVIKRRWTDKNGRRITEWPAYCNSPTLPNEANAALIVALVNAAHQIIALMEREAQMTEAQMREALIQISEIDTFAEPVSVQIARAELQPKETDDAD